MSMTKRRKKRQPRSTAAGRKIVHALRQLVTDLQSGIPLVQLGYTVRHVAIESIPKPAPWSATAVAELRRSLGVSQPLFAAMVGVSAILVQGWEQGVRVPNPMARRLLDEIAREPERWRKMASTASGHAA